MDLMIKCNRCGRNVQEDNLDRDGECSFCRAEDRANEMTVGDLGGK